MSSSFTRLDPALREYIYEKKWEFLKDIQNEAINAIFNTDNHLLIAAGTAAGKTEACFFPVITLLRQEKNAGPDFDEKAPDEKNGEGVDVLYIGPLKALINDQFERLAPLLQNLDIRLWRWHGDVGETHKQKLLDNPSGILQITPESLEALLLRRPRQIKKLFGKIKFIIIDEVHAFTGTDRGSQLICLLERIRKTAGCDPRRVGLSATLGDYDAALAWLGAGTARAASLLKEGKNSSPKEGRRLSLAVDYFAGEAAPDTSGGFYSAIYEQCRGDAKVPLRKCIIFTNSRLEAEEITAALKKIARLRGEEDHFYVHHGSIAAALRAETERNLRDKEGAQTIAATATLELGIDIGKLDRIIQIGSPMSVSAFVQRLGRSGRKSGVSQMYFCSKETAEVKSGSGLDTIPWTLLKTAAVIQLYLEEQWTEESERKPLPYSLLCHQTLSVLASLGEHDEEGLASSVLSLPPFAEVDSSDYGQLLKCLEKTNYIERTEEGKFIIGLEGERIVNHYSFFSVFPDEEEFRVCFMGKELGKINFIPPEGAGLVLGGRTWKVENINRRGREINVTGGTETGAKIWRGGSGSLHTKIVRRMRRLLLENKSYPYMTLPAAARLREGIEYAEEIEAGSRLLIPHGETGSGENIFFLIPWLGSRGMRSLSLILQKKENRADLEITALEQENHYAFRIISKLQAESFLSELKQIISELTGAETLVEAGRVPFADKYDYLLPQRLLVKQYAANMLDINEIKELEL